MGSAPRRSALPDNLVAAGDVDGDGQQDLVADSVQRHPLLYPGIRRTGGYAQPPRGRPRLADHRPAAGRRRLERRRQGRPDRSRAGATGTLWLYPGPGRAGAGFATRTRVGTGFGGFGSITAAGDVNGDHHPDLVVHKGDGILRLYPGNGRGGFLAPSTVGHGWQHLTALVGGGDYNSDGKADLIGRDAGGTLWLYPGPGRRGRRLHHPGPGGQRLEGLRPDRRAGQLDAGPAAPTCSAARPPTTRCGSPTATGAAASSAAAASAPAGDPADRSRGHDTP